MRILVIAQTFPFPPDTGSRNVVLHWLKALATTHDVELLLVDPSEVRCMEIDGLPGVRIRSTGEIPAMSIGKRLARLLESIRKGIPAASLAGMSPLAMDFVARIGKDVQYDVVVLPENATAGYAPLLRGSAPVLLYKHSVQAVDAHEERVRRGVLHPRWLLEEWIVRRFEGKSCHAADLVCTVNAEDARHLERLYDLTRTVHVIPIGVDLSVFPPRDRDPGGRVIAFFGNLAWAANRDAVVWFVREVLPAVRRAFPDARFRVIGPGDDELRAMTTDPHVDFFGRVSALAPALDDVAVGVVPVVSGTGVRFKLLELMSLGIPTVTTSLGKLGTRAVHGEHVLVADDPRQFAQAVITLLSDEALRRRLSTEGPAVARELSWDGISASIRRAVEIVGNMRPSL